MAIRFEDALNTLVEMFPHIPRESVKNCLIQNNGHMENTVAVLLALPPGGFPAPAPQPRSGRQPGFNRPVQRQNRAAPRQNRAMPRQQVWGRPQYPPRQQRQQPRPAQPPQPRRPQHNLADDFLRPPSYYFGKYGAVQNPSMSDEDAILAKVLQDSLFMSQLRENPEWVLQQMNNAPSSPRSGPANNAVSREQLRNRIQGGSNDSEELKGRIKGMGNTVYDPNATQEQKNFSSKFSGLGSAARAKLARIAQGMQRKQKYQNLSMDDRMDGGVGAYKPPSAT